MTRLCNIPMLSPVLVLGVVLTASATRAEVSTATAPDPLPIRDVVLFTSGVGYFQRAGRITGATTVPLVFRTRHVDDILKSLLLIDPDGKVEPVTYTAQEPVEQALKAFGINVSANLSMTDLLLQLRGVRVQVTTRAPQAETVVGVVLGVEIRNVQIKQPDGSFIVEQVNILNLLTDSGIHPVSLRDLVDLKILDETLAAQLKQALGVLAAGHDPTSKTVTLHFGDGPARDVQAGYVTEAPVWKTSYRLALGNKPYMQGWAIVDNSTDHDWKNVNLSLVSGQPISFIQDLYTPLYIPRPVVPPEVQANPYPQLSEDNVMENAKASALAEAGPVGEPGPTGPVAEAPARRIKSRRRANGATNAAPPPAAPMAMASGGAAPMADELESSGVKTAATGVKAGELFQYRIGVPVNILRQQSAMIPIVSEGVRGEKLDLYNADVNPEHPSNAVEMTNSTGLHLKAGPVTVLDGGGYAGDARMPEMEPGETQLITYAVDLGVTGVREAGDSDVRVISISIKHGVLNIINRQESTVKYTFKSKLSTDRTVLVEQPISQGWALKEPVKPDEKTRTFYRFRIAVPAGKSVPFNVVQAKLDTQTTGLIDMDLNEIIEISKGQAVSPAVQAALAVIAAKRQHIAQLQNELNGQKARIGVIANEQDRLRKNMAQLAHDSALYKRYVGELDAQETQLSHIRAELDRLQQEITNANNDLSSSVAKLDVS